MNPRFEEHDNQLFRMLDKPVPLAPDAEMPCLVRFIQDDSPMGKYNNDRDYFDVISDMLFIAQKIKENPNYGISVYGNTPHAYEKNSLNQDYFIASIYALEIIGYPVEEGSAEWALWAMMEENKVINSNSTVPFTLTDDRIVRIDDSVSWDVGHWLRIFDDTTGWQIYEPETEFKVGDWVKYDIDSYLQVIEPSSYDDLMKMSKDRTLCRTLSGINVYPYTSLLTKASHSEVVVPITISGTVRPAYNEDGTIDDEQFQLLPNGSWDGTEMFISFDALDSHTRKLVEGLLKAQEEQE